MQDALTIAIETLKNIYVAAQESGSKLDTTYLTNYIATTLQQIKETQQR